jgi:hypothetical protein
MTRLEQSSKGIFASPAAQGLNLRARNRRLAKKKLDDFAELLADGHEPGAAAVLLGHMPDYGRVLLGKLTAKYGWQAQ